MKSTREKAGLGSPPLAFYTNPNVSMNSALKEKTNYTRMQWPEFNLKMHEFVTDQYAEVEKAIINGGKYALKNEYKSLDASSKWWKMSEEQRKHYLRRFLSQLLTPSQPFQTDNKGKGRKITQQDTFMLISADEFQLNTGLPKETANGIHTKAKELANNSKASSHVPDGNPKDRFVLSKSLKQPHLVTVKNGKEYACDDRCPHFQSLSICAHTVASAQMNGDLPIFLNWFANSKRSSSGNLYQLAKHGMPSGAGRKGGKAPWRRKRGHDEVRMDDTTLPLNVELPGQSSNPITTQKASNYIPSSFISTQQMADPGPSSFITTQQASDPGPSGFITTQQASDPGLSIATSFNSKQQVSDPRPSTSFINTQQTSDPGPCTGFISKQQASDSIPSTSFSNTQQASDPGPFTSFINTQQASDPRPSTRSFTGTQQLSDPRPSTSFINTQQASDPGPFTSFINTQQVSDPKPSTGVISTPQASDPKPSTRRFTGTQQVSDSGSPLSTYPVTQQRAFLSVILHSADYRKLASCPL